MSKPKPFFTKKCLLELTFCTCSYSLVHTTKRLLMSMFIYAQFTHIYCTFTYIRYLTRCIFAHVVFISHICLLKYFLLSYKFTPVCKIRFTARSYVVQHTGTVDYYHLITSSYCFYNVP